MRKNIKSLSSAAGKLALKVNNALPEGRAHEVRLTTLGGIAGTIGGATLIGGMGLAALGTAVPLAGFAVAGVSCAIVGNKIGSELDRRKTTKRQGDEHY
ncbi:uncharacterized protein YcfJ [Agrobacterium tumefaciens]|uniref:hypothetical protein n=1 Tax=Agrobacterium tumefaciens TaxID=358 RepID=UPI000DD77F48|nr:hypothetical protein [Agrobacterium tumefaciens]MBP2569012.1 uncharacterized protein YcfJ [Agrobacterium tumefaciens]